MNLKSLPSFFDIHGHVNFEAFAEDRETVIKRALDAGVWLNVVGTQIDTSKAAVALAEKYEQGVYAIVGLHPIHTSKSYHDEQELGEGGKEFTSRGEIFDMAEYRKLALHPKVVAIGECGLDYYRIENQESGIEIQKEVFLRQIELTLDVKKPLMLHLRNGSGKSAYFEAFNILDSRFSIRDSNIRGNLHFFAGSIEEAKPFLDAGFTFSFTGAVTYPPRKGEKSGSYDEIIKYLPLDRIMSETDCPYVSPVPFRGKRNEPLYVQEVVKKIAAIRGEEFEKVRVQLAQNALNFFRIA